MAGSISWFSAVHESGLIGLQICGPHFGEQTVLTLAQAYEQFTNWHARRAGRIGQSHFDLSIKCAPSSAGDSFVAESNAASCEQSPSEGIGARSARPAA